MPEAQDINRLLADACRHQRAGKLAEAEDLCVSAVAHAPERVDVWCVSGGVHRALGRVDAAASAFRQALDLDPDNSNTRNLLAVALVEMGRFDEGIAEFQRAIALKPGDAELRFNLGLALRQVRRNNDAIAAWKIALEINPQHAGARRGLQEAGVLPADRPPPAARRPASPPRQTALPSSLGELPSLGELLGVAWQAHLAKDFATAEAGYRRALEIDSGQADVWYLLGAVLHAAGRAPAAVDCFQRAISLKPDYADAHNYDQSGNVVQEDLPSGASEFWSYDTHWNEVTQFIDPMGRVTDYMLDPNTGNVLSMTEKGNGSPDRATTYSYTPKPTGQGQTPGGLLATETDPRGIETEWFYNSHGMATEIVEAANSTAPATLTFGYDSQDDMTYSTNELGATTTYHVDYLGRTIETDLPAIASGQPITYDSYDALGRLASETQLQSVSGTTTYSVTTNVYDSADNLIQSIDGMGRTTAYEYDSVNRQVAEQDPDPSGGGNNTSFNIHTANGPVNAVSYDPLGNVVAQVNALGAETDDVYDLDGNLLSSTEPAPTSGAARPVMAYSYDYDDETMSATSPLGGVTYFTYNSFGELVEEQDPSPDGKEMGPTTIYQYDPDGNLVAETGPNGATTQFIFNDRNEMVEEIDPSPDGTAPGATTQWMYDLAGQVTQMIDAASRVTEYDFDADGNLMATVAPNLTTGGAGDASTTTSDAYDLAGDKISETSPTPNGASLSATTFWQYNALGEVIQETDPTPTSGGVAPVWQYQYDADQELTKTVDPLNRTETVVFDGLGRTASQVDYTGVTTDWSYDSMSNVLGETVGAGTSLAQVTTNAYNALDELTSTTAPNGGVTSFQYDLDSNRTSLVDSDHNTSTWSYDLLDRVTSETTPNGTGTATATYLYDADSNLVQTVDADGRVIDYQYNALDEQTAEIWQQVAVSTVTAGYGGHSDSTYALVLPTAATGGTWTVTAANQTTVALPDDASPAEVRLAIAELSSVGQGNVSVSGLGSPAQPFVVTFSGALAATSVTLTANYSGITVGSGSQPGGTTQTSWGGPGTDQQEVVGYAVTGDYGVTGGEFTLTYGGDTTGPLAYNATPAQVQTALAGLADIGANNVEVTGPSGSGIGATGADVYTVTFVGSLGGKYSTNLVSMQSVSASPLVDSQGSTSDIAFESGITRGGADEVDAVQQIVVTQTSGSFALSYGGESTPAQPVGESQDALQSALRALPGLALVYVSGGGTAADPYLVEFEGDLSGESVPLLVGTAPLNTITTAFNPDGSISSIGDNYSHYAYTYDGEGNTATVDNNGTPNVPRVVLTSQFDAAGNRASLSATINGKADFVNTYNYDALSQVTQIEQSGVTGGNTVAYKELDYTFDPLGDVTSRAAYSQANTPRTDVATGQYGYNSLGQLTSLNYTSNSGTTAIDDLGWSYDSLGRVSTFSSVDGTATYGYDNMNEVTSADYTTATGQTQPPDLSFSFDANGNRPAENGSTTIDNEVTDDGTYHYTFDADGNRLTETPDSGAPSSDHPASFTYDYRNRLVEVQEFNNATPPTLTEQINYTYDVYNDLIERVDDVIGQGTSTTHYVWDQLSPLAPGEGQGGGGIVLAFNGNQQLTARYLNGPNTSAYDQYFSTLAEDDLSAGVTFDLPDELGTLRDIVNSSGEPVDHLNYDSFGQLWSQTSTSFTHLDGFAGGYYDSSTGLLNFINRWYDPTATVWISADPSGFTAGDMNLRRYVGNDPTNAMDPNGLGKEHTKNARESTREDHQINEARKAREQAAKREREAEAAAKSCDKAGTKNINKRIDNLRVERKALERRNLAKPSPELEAEMQQIDELISKLKDLRNAKKARGGFVSLGREASEQAAKSVAREGGRRAAGLLGELAGPIIVGGFAAYDAWNTPYDENTECVIGPHTDRFIESVIDQLAIGNMPSAPEPQPPTPLLITSSADLNDEQMQDPADREYRERLMAIQNDDTPLAEPN